MKIRILSTVFVVAIGGLIALAADPAPVPAPPATNPIDGFTNTPMLPGGKWHVHDPDRPQPPVVTSGTFSSQDQPGRPPSDAIVLFDGSGLSEWRDRDGKPAAWKIEDGALIESKGDLYTKQEFGDIQLHVEFSCPSPGKGSGQGRGNSGVFLMGKYEVQVLDNYGFRTYADGAVGSLYGQHPPLVNPSRPPGEWQVYDILFTTPRFGADGSVKAPAYVTILLNGVVVQNHESYLGPTGWKIVGRYTPHGPTGPISLQDHGNPTRFRNIWVRPLKSADETPMSATLVPKKVLVVTTTTAFQHGSIPTAERIVGQLAAQSGAFTVEYLRQPDGRPTAPKNPGDGDGALEKYRADQAAYTAAELQWQEKLKETLTKLSPESLKNYDAVCFLSTSGDLPIPDKQGFLDWIKSGKAFIGVHAASDTFHGWPAFIEMLGGEFKQHGAQVEVECLNEDPANRANLNLGRTWTIQKEEIYQFKNYNAANVHELLVLDKHPNDRTPGHYPISWCRPYGNGKVFYTALGHREDIWDADPKIADRKNPVETSKAFQDHLLGGIEWALGIGAPAIAEAKP